MPTRARTSHNRTPVHTPFATADGPQLKPMVFFVMFCSLRRLPEQMYVTGMVTGEPRRPVASSSMVTSQVCGTPLMWSRCVSQDSLGTAPWLRTKVMEAGVTQPASCNFFRGGSELKGWRPVRRTMSGCRRTHSSLVPLSGSATTSAFCFSGIFSCVGQPLVESWRLPSISVPSQPGLSLQSAPLRGVSRSAEASLPSVTCLGNSTGRTCVGSGRSTAPAGCTAALLSG
mmetsp:Transcript_27932/g.87012  ORF Transcript_27932/g.87012 Transcript_27932/m.87012 type:complete len:229 (-) Transcript_27932:1623-2309(-)